MGKRMVSELSQIIHVKKRIREIMVQIRVEIKKMMILLDKVRTVR